MSEVTVIIPNYNGIQYIGDCLECLRKQTMDVDIIVVDNVSTDGSDDVAGACHNVKLINLSQNFGF